MDPDFAFFDAAWWFVAGALAMLVFMGAHFDFESEKDEPPGPPANDAS